MICPGHLFSRFGECLGSQITILFDLQDLRIIFKGFALENVFPMYHSGFPQQILNGDVVPVIPLTKIHTLKSIKIAVPAYCGGGSINRFLQLARRQNVT